MWSWLLMAIGVTGLLVAGRGRALGWLIGLSAQGLWLAYGLVTHQGGFVVSAFVYGAVYARNALAWTRQARVQRQEASA